VNLPVLTAVTGVWEAPLVAGLERARGDVHVVRRCADLAELLSAAQAGLGRAAVVSGDLHRLDREALAQLRRAGVAVVGLADPLDPDGEVRLVDLGAGRVLPADASAAEVAEAVAQAVRDLAAWEQGPALRPSAVNPSVLSSSTASPSAGGGRHSSSALADPAEALVADTWPGPAANSFDPLRDRPARNERGRLVAVWGPTGAPGRTTVALTLAGELAALGAQTLVVDADTYGPSIAQTLGLFDESGGIAGALRSANQGGLDVERLARLTPSLSSTLRVLTGLPQPVRWPELRPSGLDVLWQRARELARWTVIDCGFCLEADEEIVFDTSAPRRNGATLSALAAADVVLAVAVGDPVGLQRLVRALGDLEEALGRAVRPRVIVTRVRAEAVGPDPVRRITDALARYAGVDDVILVPDDRPACDAAMLAGRLLVEVVPGSPARRPFIALASVLEAELAAGLPSATGTRS
jgi:MinD-like ATPase involved in chromosome partitioning or flagellar assembly